MWPSKLGFPPAFLEEAEVRTLVSILLTHRLADDNIPPHRTEMLRDCIRYGEV